jgi:hypothetical protein
MGHGVVAARAARSLTPHVATLILETIRSISHGLRARLLAGVLLLPLIALATAMGGVDLRCRITGQVLNACCCDGGDSVAAKSSPVATVSEAGCCDRIVRDVTTAPVEMRAAPSALPDQSTPVVVVVFDSPTTDFDPSALSPRSEARASLGPPTVRLRLVSKSTFLI